MLKHQATKLEGTKIASKRRVSETGLLMLSNAVSSTDHDQHIHDNLLK
jgi:hypothetical protein